MSLGETALYIREVDALGGRPDLNGIRADALREPEPQIPLRNSAGISPDFPIWNACAPAPPRRQGSGRGRVARRRPDRAAPADPLQGHRKVDEAVKILLTANSGEERLAMKSGFFESAPVGS